MANLISFHICEEMTAVLSLGLYDPWENNVSLWLQGVSGKKCFIYEHRTIYEHGNVEHDGFM